MLPPQATVRAQQGQLEGIPIASIPTSLGTSPLAQLLTPQQLEVIATEAGLCDSFNHGRWTFWLTPGGGTVVGNTTGTASWLGIRASRQGDHLTVEWRCLDATVQFAQPCSQVQRERRGGRRYGVCGPKKKHEWTELVPRGLTADEVATVKNYLEAAVRGQPLFLN